MTATTVRSVTGWEALDSRGRPTVGCRVGLAGGGTGRVIVPSGASTGSHEARERRDGDERRYGGKGVRVAVDAVNGPLAGSVMGIDAEDLEQLDRCLEDADGDPLLGNLGANAVLAISLAALVAVADQARQPLWRVLAGEAEPLLPRPMVNVISGGAHAGGLLDIQDVLVVPVGATTFAQGLEWSWRVREATASVLAEMGAWSALVADEGGLSGPLAGNEAAIRAVTEGAHRAGLEPGRDVGIAVDLAANQFHRAGTYTLRCDGVEMNAREWTDQLYQWCDRYPIVSLEDVLYEDDWPGWWDATRDLGGRRQLIGDDLFATDLARLERGIGLGVANAVLVKPNQAGTVSRAQAVLRRAQRAGYATIVSARSGDTEDHWLADLAVGWRAGQIKVGSTQRSERTAKWNRLLEIEAVTGDNPRLWQPNDGKGRPGT
jgi:enolase